MSFWNKLGKIALVAAPYVAAPFTGGASLAFTGAANKAASKWAQHDAKKAAEKGIAPSKFDKYLLMGANAGSLATGMGAFSGGGFGKGGGSVANTATNAGKISATGQQLSGWQDKLQTAGNIASAASGAPTYGSGGSDWKTAAAGMVGDYIANQAANRSQPTDQPVNGFQGRLANLAQQRVPTMSAVERGRQDALRSQPFRSGYETRVQGDDEGQVITAQMPPIYPQYQSPIQSESGQSQQPISPFMDNLTPRRMARRRNPVEEEVYD